MHNINLSALLPLFWADKSSEKCGGLKPSKSYKEYNEREFRSNFFS